MSYNESKQYDALLCISALEHFKNPDKIIKKFASMLNTGGYLFIEVPDSLKPKAQIAEFYSFEHLSHFTKHTLTRLLKTNAFGSIEYDQTLSLPNIRLVAKKKEGFNVLAENDIFLLKERIGMYAKEREKLLNTIKIKLDPIIHEIEKKNKNLAIYGAGDHTKFLIESFGIKKLISCFFDSDPLKKGATLYNKKIYGPESICTLNIDIIIISSHDYEKEIFNTVSKFNKNHVKVITLYSDYDK